MAGIPGLETLRKIQMFSSLNDQEMAEVVGKIIFKQYLKDEVILWQDDTNYYMYLVISGQVKVVHRSEDGTAIIRAIHAAGDSFGELSLLDGKTSPAEVVAMKATSVAIISKDDFVNLIHTHEKVLDNLLQMFCSRLRDSWERVQILNLKYSMQRLIMLFQQLSVSNGEPLEEGTLLNIKLTHQTLASMTGLSRESVTRTLDILQKDKCINMRGKDKKVIILPGFLKLGFIP